MRNVRQDVVHKLTAGLVGRFRFIGIERLNVKGLARTRMAKSTLDAAPFELRRQLAYKAPLAQSVVVEADPFFPSSKTCSVCGLVNQGLRLEKVWTCEGCKSTHDRDENASENLRQLAAAHAVTAHCPRSSGPLLPSGSQGVKLPVGWEPGSYVSA